MVINSTPLISVIVPNYNYECFLEQRISTILNQSYTNLEVIILDDCSVDNSKEIIQKYRNQDSRIKHVIYNEFNSGSTFKQWNKGLALATGEFVWIAESDDYADPDFLKEVVTVMSIDKSIKIGFSNSYWLTPDEMFVNKDYTISKPSKVYEGISFVKRHLLKENYIYNASMAVFRADALEHVDKTFESYKSCGDKLFWSSMARTGKVLFVNKPLNYFRIHSTKVTTRSIANGVLFKEEHKLFKKNIEEGYITLFNRLSVVLYFLKYIYRMRDGFDSEEIYNDCLLLWKNECNYKNSKLPLVYRMLCLMVRV